MTVMSRACFVCRILIKYLQVSRKLNKNVPFSDGVPCVLGNNIDGYIPIKFTPNATYYIQGKQKEC